MVKPLNNPLSINGTLVLPLTWWGQEVPARDDGVDDTKVSALANAENKRGWNKAGEGLRRKRNQETTSPTHEAIQHLSTLST